MTLESRRDKEILRTYQSRLYNEKVREKDNWRVYDATDLGQFNSKAIAKSVQEGMPLSQFNISKKLIDITYGSIQADPFELHYATELGDSPIGASVLENLFMEDKDLGQFDAEYDQFVRAGFIYRGYLQMYKDRKEDRRGRVNVRYWHGDMVTPDPDRRTLDINANDNIFTHLWMNPQKIKDKFPDKASKINHLIKLWEMSQGGEDAVSSEGNTDEIYDPSLNDRSNEFYDKENNRYMVMTKYWLKKAKYWDIYDPMIGETITTKPREEAELLAENFMRQGRQMQLLEHNIMECWIRTTCPGIDLDMVLSEGPYELQVGGYPWFEFSSDKINGRPHTYMDDLKDPQISFNKRENTATHIMMTAANNHLLIEEDAMKDDNDIDVLGKTRNKPGSYSILASGAIAERKVDYLKHGNSPNELFSAASHIKDIIQDLTPAVPSMQAVGQSQESGVLFQSKLQQAMVAVQIPTKLLKSFWQRFGSCYIMAAKQVYTYPMRISSNRENTTFELNVTGGIQMAEISRLKVTVSQSPTSETYRRRLLQSYLSIAQYLQDPYLHAQIMRIVVGALPDVPEEELERLKSAAELSAKAQEVILMGQISQMQAQGGQPQQQQKPVDKERLLNKVMQGVAPQGAPA